MNRFRSPPALHFVNFLERIFLVARVHDASHSGVLLFGGIVFTPNTTSIGPMMNQTWVWADSACPK